MLPSPTAGTFAPAGPPSLRAATARPLVILPTLNEVAGLEQTLNELYRTDRFPEGRIPDVLIVDGHSNDGTLEVAARHPCTVLTQHERGKGAAVREGLAWALENRYDYVGLLDADATYPPDRLPALFGLLDLGADVVVGLRRPEYSTGRTARDLVHRVGNGGLNFCGALFGRGPILDVCSGFWGLRTSIIGQLDLDSNGFEIESELFVKSARLGMRVVQIPVSYRERVGTAKLQAGRDGARIMLSIIRQSHRAAGLTRSSGSGPGATFARVDGPDGLPGLILALAYTLDTASVRVRAPAGLRKAAQGIADRLAESKIRVELLLDAGSDPDTEASPGRRASGDSAGSLDVILLADVPGPAGPLSALVSVPRSHHYLRLGTRGTSPPPSRARFPLASRARRSPESVRSPGPLQIAGATMDSTGVQKVITLLTANFSASHIEVHGPGEMSALPAAALGLTGPRGTAGQTHVG